MNGIAMPGLAAIIAVLSELLEIGLVIFNGSGEMEFASPRGRELLGCGSRLELSYCYPGARDAVRDVITRSSAEPGMVVRKEARFVVSETERDVSIEAYPIEGEGCRGFLLIVRDEGNVRRVAADLQLNAELRNTRRLFETVMSDLKQPISAALVHLELLKGFINVDGSDAESGALRSWSAIRSQVSELNRMLTLLLEEISPATTEERGFSLRDVLQDVARLVAPQGARQNVVVELTVSSHAARLNGSRQLVKQAILNVAWNALESMPSGGTLRMELEVDDDHGTIRISDTGTGIDPDALPRIFEVDYTTKEGGARGIGLHIAREVIQKHEGEIAVHTKKGRGTEVRIRLPVHGSHA